MVSDTRSPRRDPPAGPTDSPNRRVLAVDDNPIVLRALSRMLTPTCYVMTATNGEDALGKARHFGPFSVVLMDQRMPGLTGVELMERIRELCSQTTFVMLTGHGTDPAVQQLLSEGRLARMLTKPCPIDDIIEAVHAADRVYQVSAPLIGAAD